MCWKHFCEDVTKELTLHFNSKAQVNINLGTNEQLRFRQNGIEEQETSQMELAKMGVFRAFDMLRISSAAKIGDKDAFIFC